MNTNYAIPNIPRTIKDAINQSLEAGGQLKKVQDNYSDEAASIINRNNPALSSRVPWEMAKARKRFVNAFTLPMIIATAYFETLAAVLYPEPNKGDNS